MEFWDWSRIEFLERNMLKDLKYGKLLNNEYTYVLGYAQIRTFECNAFGSHAGAEWEKWRKTFELHLEVNNITEDARKKTWLLYCAGEQVREIFENLPGADVPPTRVPQPYVSVYEVAMEKLNEYFRPKTNSTYEKHILRAMKQEDGEKIEKFAVRLRQQAARCELGTQLEISIKDQIIEKCTSAELRRRLLEKGEIPLEQVLKIAAAYETIAEQEKAFKNGAAGPDLLPTEPANVNRIERHQSNERSNFDDESCSRCGKRGHKSQDEGCPARKSRCYRCNNVGHFGRKCRTRQNRIDRGRENQKGRIDERKSESSGKRQKREIVSSIENYGNDSEYIFCIEVPDKPERIQCIVGNIPISAIVDSGSRYNLIDSETWDFMKEGKIRVTAMEGGTNKRFKAYGGSILTIRGSFVAEVDAGGSKSMECFYVMEEKGHALIGSVTAQRLGILRIGHEGQSEKAVEMEEKIVSGGLDVSGPFRQEISERSTDSEEDCCRDKKLVFGATGGTEHSRGNMGSVENCQECVLAKKALPLDITLSGGEQSCKVDKETKSVDAEKKEGGKASVEAEARADSARLCRGNTSQVEKIGEPGVGRSRDVQDGPEIRRSGRLRPTVKYTK